MKTARFVSLRPRALALVAALSAGGLALPAAAQLRPSPQLGGSRPAPALL